MRFHRLAHCCGRWVFTYFGFAPRYAEVRRFAAKISQTVEDDRENLAERDSFPFTGVVGSTHFDVPATQKRAQRNQITRKLALPKFAKWTLCFCHIRGFSNGQFNQGGNKHHETKTHI